AGLDAAVAEIAVQDVVAGVAAVAVGVGPRRPVLVARIAELRSALAHRDRRQQRQRWTRPGIASRRAGLAGRLALLVALARGRRSRRDRLSARDGRIPGRRRGRREARSQGQTE